MQCLQITLQSSSEEMKLREELKDMRRELASIPMVDEFARYAKLQRKMKKVEQELISKVQSRMDRREAIQTKWTRTFHIVNVIIHSISFVLSSVETDIYRIRVNFLFV